jgi:hypothetical protein
MDVIAELPATQRPLGLPARVLRLLGVDGALALAAAVLLAAVLLAAPERTLLALASDDAFYYFKIARSIAEGQGSTFDGIAPTNGYHPLWMVVAVSAQALGGGHPLLAAASLVWLAGALGLATLVVVRRLVDAALAPGCAAVAVALLLLPHGVAAMLNGMETSLALFTTACVLWFVERRRALDPSGPWTDAAWLGALLAAAFLARLDSIFLAFAAGGLTLLAAASGNTSWRRALARSAVMGGAFLALAAPYLALNLWSFGALMPISGTVKSSIPEIRHTLGLEGDSGFGLALLAASWLALVPVVAGDLRGQRSLAPVLRSPLILLALACTGHFLHVYLWMSWGVHWWHFAVYGLLFALASSTALGRLVSEPSARRLAVGGVMALALLALPLHVGQIENRWARHALWRDAAVWAREHTEPDAIFALKDAGLFAFFSDRRVVNLDGKANGLRYRQSLADGEVARYLGDVGVRYVADINGGCMDDGRCAILILRANRPGVFLTFPARDEVYRSAAYPPRFGELGSEASAPRFMIWRFAADEGTS